MLSGQQALDVECLGRIGRAVSVPLVLHGGSGIGPDSLRQAIALGVAKVNYGTGLKQRYLAATRDALAAEQPLSPHQHLGMGGADDVMVAARHAVRDAVAERMVQLGCPDKA